MCVSRWTRARRLVCAFLACLISPAVSFGQSEPEEGTGQAGPQAECTVIGPPGSETTDIIFVIDGSGSVDPTFEVQKQGIYETLCGPRAFIPADGTVAIAVIEFSNPNAHDIEIPLTVVSQANLTDVCDCITDTIEPQNGNTYA